jgi:type II secretory pathway component GspD/PulD (secretin)
VQFTAQTDVTQPPTEAAPAAQPSRPISDDELDRLLDLIDPPQAAPAGPAPGTTVEHDSPRPIVVPATPQPKPAADPNAPVTITVLGDDLVISAADPEVRARMEELIEQVMNSVPPRTTWTIFPLEHSDVTTTAAMLSQLFPDSTVASADSVSGGGGLFSSLSSGFSSMSSSLAGMSGLTSSSSAGALRIIPYPTDNALFISGPEYKIREVEDMLRILDSGELSASLRERTPRMIPVRYAEIDDVYTMVKDVYKDALETEQDRGARNAANMFSQMMGGSRRGGDSAGSAPVAPLSLGVDRQTSQLIVSSSESKFQEIKSLVEQIDRSALEAKRTVKVVTLQNTSTSQLKNTVSTLMPRVVVSSTGSRSSAPSSSSSSSSSSNGSSNGGGESRGPDPEQFRRMMEERMRSMQGGSGGGDSGRPSFSGSPFGGGSSGRPSFGGGGPFGGGFGGRPSFGGGDRGR